MALFFFHIRQNNVLFEDKQGVDLPGAEEAWEWAVQDAKTLTQEGALDGAIDQQWVEVTDEAGSPIASLPFKTALQFRQ
jgi:hypothetical protein